MTSCPSAAPLPPAAPSGAEHEHRPVRVVFDSGIFLERHFGGVMRYIHELATGMAAELAAKSLGGSTVEVRAGLNVAPLDLADFVAGTCTGMRMPALRGATRLYRRWNDLRLAAALRSGPEVPTILHETLYGADLSVPRHVRRVVTVHDLIWEDEPALAPPLGLKQKARSIAAADGVIFVSEATRRAFTGHYKRPRLCAVIPHGSELRTARSRRAPGVPRPFILYVGQRQGYKNWEAAVRALMDSRLLDEFGLVMFGPPPSRREMAFIAGLGDTQRVAAWLEGDDDVLADLYASAASIVYPSRSEGFGMPLLEAARLGCPVACSDIEPFREMLGGHAAYFDPDNGASISAAVAEAVAAGRDRPKVLAAARRSAEFTWRDTCRLTLDFYREVLGAA